MRLGWGTSQRPVAAQPVTRHDRLAVQTQTAPPTIPVPAANAPRAGSDEDSSTGASSTARSVRKAPGRQAAVIVDGVSMRFPDLTVRENVDFVGSLFGMLFRSRGRRTRQVLELLDLWPVRARRAGRLSGGQQRRLELACALVHDPALLFLDEPTAGIDPLLRVRVWDELHRLRDDGRTLIVTTQHIEEAEACDQVALIATGRLVALATPDELRRQAMGGDVVAIETAAAFDGGSLRSLPFVRRVRQDGPRSMTVVVDDAGTATPDVVEAIRAETEVVSAREERPTFDEVFAILVERARQETAQ